MYFAPTSMTLISRCALGASVTAVGVKAAQENASAMAEIRGVRQIRTVAATLADCAGDPLEICAEVADRQYRNQQLADFFDGLDDQYRHYWIASLYALLMDKERRRQLAAYFTPPHLVDFCIDTLVKNGIVVGKHRILDPASGGAAFLVPLAQRIAFDGKQTGKSGPEILMAIKSSLSGVEVDPGLSDLSKLLMSKVMDEAGAPRIQHEFSITNADTLTIQPAGNLFDAVVGNPPYGRAREPGAYIAEFENVISAGYVNLYALFIEASLRWTKPGGIVCLVVPMSFIGGPYFEKLRAAVLDQAYVVQLNPVHQRDDLFLDVLYDVCVLVLRKKGPGIERPIPTSTLLHTASAPEELGSPEIPNESGSRRIWALPSGSESPLFAEGLFKLSDYGVRAKVGYFVWNREKDRYGTRPSKPAAGEVPLYWAHGIRANADVRPQARKLAHKEISVVKISEDSDALIRTDAVILQRTTNRRQNRRLVAGMVRRAQVPGTGDFIAENHTILLLPIEGKELKIPLHTLCRLINTAAVDNRFRRISGTVSVSAKALALLPLPNPIYVATCFTGEDDETAALTAYELTMSSIAAPAEREVPQ